jgi:hypothetical protein
VFRGVFVLPGWKIPVFEHDFIGRGFAQINTDFDPEKPTAIAADRGEALRVYMLR